MSHKLLNELKKRDFSISTPPYTCFSAKKKGVSCTLYTSGKLVVQGKESAEFIEFFLEPEILQSFSLTHPLAETNYISHTGVDESGKGDFFGPLCIAGVFVPTDQFPHLLSLGVKDSKKLSDVSIKKIGLAIKKHYLHHIVRINPPKYNQIYQEFKNLNRLLAWGHATVIEQLVEKSECDRVAIDQFADESVVLMALKRKGLNPQLQQRHRGEEDPAVAAASILARFAFIEGMDQLSEQLGINLPKGCSPAVLSAAEKILSCFGEEELLKVCKQHFKTLDSILTKWRK